MQYVQVLEPALTAAVSSLVLMGQNLAEKRLEEGRFNTGTIVHNIFKHSKRTARGDVKNKRKLTINNSQRMAM